MDSVLVENRGMRLFAYLWPAATVVIAVLALTSSFVIFIMDQRVETVKIGTMLIMMCVCLWKVFQLIEWISGDYFTRLFSIISSIIATALLVMYTIPRFWFGPDPPIVARITILSNAIICVAEMWLGERFRQHMRDMRVLQCADYLIAGDALSFGRTSRGPIFLRGHDSWDDSGPDASPEIEEPEPFIPIRPIASDSTSQEQSIVPWSIPVELTQNVIHHASLGPNSSWPTNKPLWITVDTEKQCNEVVHAVYDIISSSQSALALQVDTSRTHSIFWPLVHALVLGLAAFREELTSQPPKAFRDHLWCYPFAHMPSGHRSPYNRSEDVGRVIRELITIPLANRKDVRPPQRDIVLIVNGIRDKEQAGELYATITQLQKRKIAHAGLGFVAISLPTQLRRAIGDGNYGTMLRISTLYAGDNCVIYSGGKGLTPPAFYEKIFRLLVDAIHRGGGPEATSVWKKLRDLSISAEPESALVSTDAPTDSTLKLFSTLYNVSQIRRKLLELLAEIAVVPQESINKYLERDNIKLAETLQMLFTIRSYKKDIPTLPKEHAFAAMNLIHYILDGGLPENGAIQDYENFARQGHLVLNRLAQYVGILPEELTIQGVVLLSEAPVNGGGFSNIYQGVYTNSAGEQVEVALKVLRIFEDQPDERRQILHNKFSQEALVWHYLKHKNIVPFLGVDSTTFRSPVRAMVSPWMPLGSVLKYMVENPSSPSYALGVLSDVLDGLSYLHSANVIHGDLCGRNILMDENGRARLTDFGLASFIESDTSMKSTTRSGTTRWMAPELLRPAEGVHFRRTTASDVWAFGCVCCEIWSGGDVPFSHLGKEMEILFAVFAADAKGMPYPNRPTDKAGNPMPNQLWELAQTCWSFEPSERPLVPVLVDMISEMKPLTQDEDATGPQSGDITLVGGNPTTSKSDETLRTPVTRKGKGRAHVQEDATVRFGPVDIDGDPEELLESMMDGLLNFVDPELLTEPMAVEAYDSNHLGLRFRSPIEANNFAMTWMVYRFEPYAGVSAELLN